MRVLHLGATGNLGARVLPALVAHGHTVIAFVRSASKLHSQLSPALSSRITVVSGDALDTAAVASALRTHTCDAVVNTAGTRAPRGHVQQLPRIVAAVTSAAVEVGRERGAPLRAWIIGGMGSLPYPGTKYLIQDYFPASMMDHMSGTEAVVRGVEVGELRWTLLCVAMMREVEGDTRLRESPRGNELLVEIGEAPGWRDHWVRRVSLVGEYLNLLPVVRSYITPYEEVADLIAEDLGRGRGEYVGKLVGFKTSEGRKDL